MTGPLVYCSGSQQHVIGLAAYIIQSTTERGEGGSFTPTSPSLQRSYSEGWEGSTTGESGHGGVVQAA